MLSQGFGKVFAELDETKLELIQKMESLNNETIFKINNSTAVITSNQNQIKLQIDQTATEMQVLHDFFFCIAILLFIFLSCFLDLKFLTAILCIFSGIGSSIYGKHLRRTYI